MSKGNSLSFEKEIFDEVYYVKGSLHPGADDGFAIHKSNAERVFQKFAWLG